MLLHSVLSVIAALHMFVCLFFCLIVFCCSNLIILHVTIIDSAEESYLQNKGPEL